MLRLQFVMFQAWAGVLPRSLRRARPGQTTAWEEALQSMFNTQARNLHGQAWRRNAPNSRLVTGSRYGNTRPTFATRQSAIQAQAKRGFRFSPWRRNKGNGGKAEESLSLGQRFRKLSKEYGKAAVVVYFMLSILDYPFFFLLVRAVGTDRVGM